MFIFYNRLIEFTLPGTLMSKNVNMGGGKNEKEGIASGPKFRRNTEITTYVFVRLDSKITSNDDIISIYSLPWLPEVIQVIDASRYYK